MPKFCLLALQLRKLLLFEGFVTLSSLSQLLVGLNQLLKYSEIITLAFYTVLLQQTKALLACL